MHRLTANRPVVNSLAVALLVAACNSPAAPQEVQRIESLPRALTDGELALMDAGEAFAFDFLREVVREEDPAANIFGATGPLAEAGAVHSATLLPDGRVLVIGGRGEGWRLALLRSSPRRRLMTKGSPPRSAPNATLKKSNIMSAHRMRC